MHLDLGDRHHHHDVPSYLDALIAYAHAFLHLSSRQDHNGHSDDDLRLLLQKIHMGKVLLGHHVLQSYIRHLLEAYNAPSSHRNAVSNHPQSSLLDHKHDIHRVLLDDLPYYQGHFFRLLNHTLLDQLHHFRQHRHHSNLHQILHLLYHQGSFHIQRVLHLQKLLHHRLHQLAQMVMAEDHLVLLLAVVVHLVGFVQRPLSMSLFQPLLTSLTSYHPP